MKKMIRTAIFLAVVLTIGHAQAQYLHAQVKTAAATPSVALTWTPSSACVLPVTCTASVYRCVGTCAIGAGTWTLLTSASADAGAYTDSAVTAIGVASYYVVDLATGNGWSATPSAGSNVAVATFPVSAPTGLATTVN